MCTILAQNQLEDKLKELKVYILIVELWCYGQVSYMPALLPTEKEAEDLHGWRDGLARKSLHEVLDMLTSMYDRHDLQIAYSVYFYMSKLESCGEKGSESRERADAKSFLFFFLPSFLAQT